MTDVMKVFPVTPDGKLVRKKPCQTPGCKWPTWHICLDENDPAHKKIHPVKKRKFMDKAHRERIAEAQRQRHARLRESKKDRDDRIISLYVEDGLGMNRIAEITGHAQSTVNRVLKRAQAEGLLQIRPKGVNVRHQTKS